MRFLAVSILSTVLLLGLLVSCGSDGGNSGGAIDTLSGVGRDALGQRGASCTLASDCEPDLDCVDSVCISKHESSDLVWQNPSIDEFLSWQSAVDYCDNLSLDGHENWRLPDVDELRSLIRGCVATETGGNCSVSAANCVATSCKNEACDGCDWDENCGYWGPDLSGVCGDYWTSSLVSDQDESAFHISFGNGYIYSAETFVEYHVRCVR